MLKVVDSGDTGAEDIMEDVLAAVSGGMVDDFFFGEVWALLPVILCAESVLLPRDIAVAEPDFRFSRSTLAKVGAIGEGEGRGKAEALLREIRLLALAGRVAAIGAGV